MKKKKREKKTNQKKTQSRLKIAKNNKIRTQIIKKNLNRKIIIIINIIIYIQK